MAKFKIGDRAKIVLGRPEFLGLCVTIASEYHLINNIDSSSDIVRSYGYAIDVDGHNPKDHGFIGFFGSDDQLEPIIRDGYQGVEWSECLWQPDLTTA